MCPDAEATLRVAHEVGVVVADAEVIYGDELDSVADAF